MTARGTILLAGLLAASCTDGEPAAVALSPDQLEVILDPYGLAPLSALINVRGVRPEALRAVAVTVGGIDGEDLDVRLPYDAGYATRYACPERLVGDEPAVQVPVLGLYPDLDNRVRVALIEDDRVRSASLSIRTGALPAALPAVEIVTADRAAMEPGWNLAGFSSGGDAYAAQPFIYDHHGRIRWVLLAHKALGPGFISPLEPLRDGNLILGIGDAVHEYSLLGREVERWLLPEGFLQDHDVHEMPDGHLLVGGKQARATVIDPDGEVRAMSPQVVEIDRRTGAVRNLWDLRQFLDVDRRTYITPDDPQDWLHFNSVAYVPEDDTILVSGRYQGVASLTRGGVHVDDPAAGKALRWILAPRSGWGRAGFDGSGFDLAPYLLTAVDNAGSALPEPMQAGVASSPGFGWPYGQHSAKVLRDGSFFLFDNGAARDLSSYPGTPFSRGVAYRVEPAATGVGGTVRQAWEYGRDRPELYAPIVSGVDEGPVTGNRFVMPGSYRARLGGTVGGTAELVEIAADDGRVVFEAVIRMHVSSADICYRQGRVPLYRQ